MARKEAPEVAMLRAALTRHGISAITAARFIGAGAKSLYNWLHGEHEPSAIWREKIRSGLRRMERAYGPDEAETTRRLFKLVWPHLTRSEKEEGAALFGAADGRYVTFLRDKGEAKGIDLEHGPTEIITRKK